jgi:DNA polymerase-3 subunit alpha
VYQVRTFGYIKAKSACRRACQALDYDQETTNALCKSVNDEPESLKNISDKKVCDIAEHFLGHIINYSTHASAVIVCPNDINNYTTIERQKNTKTGEYDFVVAYEFHDCEAMGLLKLDILGLQHLDVIDRVIKETGVDYMAIPDRDEKTAQMIRQGHTEGVFQSESQGFTETLQEMHTEEANDVIVTNALFRPGALDSGTTKEYIMRRTGKHAVHYPVEELKPALKDTYGLFIYQEEVMAGARVLCGYSLGQADNVRRIIGRKIEEEMAPCIADMKAKAKEKGTPEEAVDEFTKVVAASASYLFNKSHAAAYGLTAWRSAYLKAHYPMQYWCSFLNQKCKDKEFPTYIKAAKRMGVNIKYPELGQQMCKVVGTGIQLGTNCIKGVGKIEAPMKKDDILKVMNQYPSNTLKALISGGALDYFKIPRNKLVGSIDGIKRHLKDLNKWHDAIKRWEANTKYKPEQCQKRIKEYQDKIRSAQMKWHVDPKFHDATEETAVFGFTFLNPFDGYDLSLVNNKTVFAGVVTRFKEITDRKGRQMAFVDIERDDKKPMNFPMFAQQYKKLEVGKPYLFGLKNRPTGFIMDSVQKLKRVS